MATGSSRRQQQPMELRLTPQEHLSPLEVLLTIYSPILESLTQNLPTLDKMALAQTSSHLRHLLLNYPLFLAHLDYRLGVFEAPSFDSYRLGTVFKLDCLLATRSLENRITSLTLDWTAVSGLLLFGKIMDRCQSTLEHLSVRGCRKVSIKHHIVPYFVYQDLVEPLSVSPSAKPKKALKSLYVYKARGVRRKPFLIDRKPADGDEPSRYLTTLANKLGIWIDLGLCPTPKLRCPRRREILKRGKEKFCVPFDKRWRVAGNTTNTPNGNTFFQIPPALDAYYRKIEERQGAEFKCDHCEVAIPHRCEDCVHQMTCTNCSKTLCHECAYASPHSPSSEHSDSSIDQLYHQPPPSITMSVNLPNNTVPPLQMPAAQAANSQAGNPSATGSEANPIVYALQPCCDTASPSAADQLCPSCVASVPWYFCDGCQKKLCLKHEIDRCRRCEGGCNRIFCFTISDSTTVTTGCGEIDTGRMGMKECLSCSKDVCYYCRTIIPTSPTPSSSDDGTEEDVPYDDQKKLSCNCKVCQENYYCTSCWPTKPIACEPKPRSILDHKEIEKGATLYLVSFNDDTHVAKWMTAQRVLDDFPLLGPQLISTFQVSLSMSRNLGFVDDDDEDDYEDITPESSSSPMQSMAEEENNIEVGEHEWILERVLNKKKTRPEDGGVPRVVYLVKWLGRDRDELTWEEKRFYPEGSREWFAMEAFDRQEAGLMGYGGPLI